MICGHIWRMHESLTCYVCTRCGLPLNITQMRASQLRLTPCDPDPLPRKGWFAEAVLPSARRNPA